MPSLAESLAKAFTDDFKDSDSGAFKDFLLRGVGRNGCDETATKPQQKRNKSATKRYSTTSESEGDKNLNRNKSATEPQQNRNTERNKTVTSQDGQNISHKTKILKRNKSATVSATKAQQKRNKSATVSATVSVTNKTSEVGYLHGNELAIINYLFEICTSIGDRTTPPLSYEKIRIETEVKSSGVVRMSSYRLIEKAMLIKNDFKNGKGGWVKFEIPKEVYRDLTLLNRNKSATEPQQNRNTERNKTVTERVTNHPSSSSLNINDENIEETATTDQWRDIDVTPLEHIGFGIGQLNQIIRKNKLTQEQVQDSINYFAFDLKHNNKKCDKPPLNMFMGIVSSGGSPYLAPDNYESETDRGVRLYVERNREIKRNRDESENEAKKLDFDNWFHGLSNEDVETIIGEKLDEKMGIKVWKASLLRHHEDNVWPIRKKEIL